VFNATFNNISVISWWSVLLVEETRVPGKTTDLPQVTDKLYHIMRIFSLAAILVGSRDHRTLFWEGAIQGPFHQSLVAIGPVVSEEKNFLKISSPLFSKLQIEKRGMKF
jgi:hypothetical protein